MLSSVVVVGASAAGLAAIETLRREGYRGSITAVDEDVYLPYDRPPLSKQVLSGKWQPARVSLRDAKALDSLDVDWLLNRRAVALDLTNRTVDLHTGHQLRFDGLVIATGVRPRRLALGHELANVYTLRSIDDALALRAAVLRAESLVVVGAGFLGAEVAAVARSMGRRVTLVDPLAAPMIRQLGPEVAERFARLHREHGVDLRCSTGVAAIEGRDGAVAAVQLTDGNSVSADAVLVAIGCTPAVEWLAGSGLSLANGVDCDEYCQAAPGVVGAGDVASWPHPGVGRVRVEHRVNAAEQAIAAAKTLLGKRDAFRPVPYFWSDQYDVKLTAYGLIGASAAFTMLADEPGRFVGVYHTEGRMVAALGWNEPTAARRLRGHVAARSPVEAVLDGADKAS